MGSANTAAPIQYGTAAAAAHSAVLEAHKDVFAICDCRIRRVPGWHGCSRFDDTHSGAHSPHTSIFDAVVDESTALFVPQKAQ